ncbi:MAG: cystathionine gamma-synthase family protein [Elusimicrobiota bacterium]
MKKTKIDDMKDKFQPESLMMSYGYKPELSEGALKCPIFQTSTFVFRNAQEGKAFFEIAYGLRTQGPREELGLIYSRLNNPDLEVLEDRLALWDKAESCAMFESGMAAIATTVLEFVRPGDVIIHSEPIYGGTDYFFKHVMSRYGVKTCSFIAPASRQQIEKCFAQAAKMGRISMVFIETPANPTNALVDIEACVALAKAYGHKSKQRVIVAVDNTFLGPLWQHPLAHGADLVLYSATKYIGGHSDVIAGACLGSRELMTRVRTLRTFMGTMGGPWTGWLLLRSLETLKLRMTCQMKNARYVADFLKDHPKVEKLYYLGELPAADPQRAVFEKQCLSAGAMITFTIKGTQKSAFKFLDSLKLFKLAVSLGGTESLAEHPATMTHADIARDQQERLGITPNMIRLSIGVENPQDLITDLKQALG